MARAGRQSEGGYPEFFDLFDQAGQNVLRAAELLEQLLAGYPDSRELATDVRDCEHTGDLIVHEVIDRLNHASVTPIDRSDILGLTSALDDIVDYIEEVADYLGLYKVEAPMEQAQELARILRDAARLIAEAIPLTREFKDISPQTIETHRLENEGDRVVRGAVAALFESGTDPMEVIRWKDIFERLESAIDSTEKAAHLLEGIVLKHT
jgi:predicted phosphate transport protein (TIGR00153 family)